MSEELGPEAYLELLQTVGKSGLPHFLEGGQAVNIWAEVYLPAAPELANFAPFTSKDCDLWASYQFFLAVEHDHLLPGTLIKSSSPLDGQLGIVQLDSPPRVIDLLQSVFGLTKQELERACKRTLVVQGVHLLDPLYLFKGKCHNYIDLNQTGRQDQRHVRILALVVPAYLKAITERACAGKISERELLNELKLFLNFRKDSQVRSALELLCYNLMDLIPVDLLANCELPKVRHFASTQL